VAAVPGVGEKFNQQFELLEVLGSGGVSTVFKARQLEGDRLVALKVLATVENDNEKFKERFLREAKAAAEFSHEGVASVLQCGQSDSGLAFAVMEFVEGESLRKTLKAEERLPTLRALKIARRAAAILEALHAKGILHRDLKTDNIFLLAQPEPDTVKLVDFAFAYLEEGDSFVRAGTLIGSPRYLSPEQGGGKAADARSDIYSLTVCLYEMLTGEKPYSANTSALLLYKHLNDPVPQIQQGQIDRFLPAVNEVISRGLAKLAGERYQSMSAFADALAVLSVDLEKVKATAVVKKDAAEESPKKDSRMGIIAAVIFVLLALLGTMIVLSPQHRKTEAEFEKHRSERKKSTIAFLEKDIARLERRKSSHAGDPESINNLTSRLRDLSEAQRDSGELAAAERSISRAITVFSENSAAFKDPDMIIKLKGQLALIRVQAKEYKGAADILAQASNQLVASGAGPGFNRRESCLIPARLELNIHLHKFDLAGRDLNAVFDLGHSVDKNSSDAPPAVATAKTAWELVSAEDLKDPQEKLAALAFVDLLIERMLDTDREMCKAPADTARNLLSGIPSDTPGYKPLADRTQALLSRSAHGVHH
jgi:eukaryotic-like serine/threonine-protein kinase